MPGGKGLQQHVLFDTLVEILLRIYTLTKNRPFLKAGLQEQGKSRMLLPPKQYIKDAHLRILSIQTLCHLPPEVDRLRDVTHRHIASR